MTAMIAIAAVLVGSLLGASAVIVRATFFRPLTITGYFSAANAIYVGDDVRVAGIKVGTITGIDPDGDRVKMILAVDSDAPIPADAKAVIVAQNLVAARYVQLTPTYQPGSGPAMKDGGVIPLQRTAVPVEWDDVKDQLMRLATEMGPASPTSTTSAGHFIDSAANAMGGNGDKLRQTLAQLSGVGRILADGSGNLVDIIKNLQTFVTALRDSNEQIVQFGDRLATLTSVLDEGRSDLDAALSTLSIAISDVQRLVKNTGSQTAEQVARLANVTQTLADQRDTLENVLHIAPTAVSNTYSAYDPDTGSIPGTFVFNNVSSPIQFICGALAGIENITATETAKLCGEYLGPALSVFNFNSLPFPINPYLSRSPDPSKLIYTEPELAPGGSGPKPGPPEIPPAVSAYQPVDTGSAPAPPVPISPAPTGLPGLLLPTAVPPSPADAASPPAPISPPGDRASAPLPGEGTPPQ
ncbi:MCE family protein [Mycobacterium terramassiliense]|nr:MCE family protein [Mycobacterium terramassiliense]